MKRHQDVTRKSGNTIRLNVTVKDEAGSPKNLAGCSARYAAAATLDGPPAIEKTTAAGITITDAAAGKLTIEISAADSEPLEGKFFHECTVTDAGGDKATVFDGRLNLLKNL